MLFDYWQSNKLIFCIDPANVDLMQDFYNDKANVRLQCARRSAHTRQQAATANGHDQHI